MHHDITHDHSHTRHFRASHRFDLSVIPWLEKEHILIKPMQVMRARSVSRVRLFATPWTVARQAPLSMGVSRQEHWSGVPCRLQGIFLTQGSNLSLQYCRWVLYPLGQLRRWRVRHSWSNWAGPHANDEQGYSEWRISAKVLGKICNHCCQFYPFLG